MYYYPQQNNMGGYQMQNQQSPLLKGRPVSSLEEARAAQIDFDGSLFFFPDIAHNRIYTKQISIDGTASMKMYELTQIPQNTSSNYITREEFNEAIEKLKSGFAQPQPQVKPIEF